MPSFRIGRRRIDNDKPAYILAEIGINHGGDISLAKEMIDAAAICGADGVKFQSFKAGDLVDKHASPEYYKLFKSVELSKADHLRLFSHCKLRDLNFLSTPFDNKMVDMLLDLGVKAVKVASGDLTHHPLLRYIGSKKIPVILSTGMSYLSEVDEARRILYESGCPSMVLLHCVSRYPAKAENLNLHGMVKLKDAFDEVVGFSDHSEGVMAAQAAVAMGAKFIEKHFTLDKTLGGPDHALSADPGEFLELVESIRFIEKAMGAKLKEPTSEELRDRALGRRGCYASKNLKRGEKLTSSKVKFTRPEGTIPSSDWINIEGRKLRKTVKKGKPFDWGMLE